MNIVEESTLLGASLLGAQKFEFALYGIISHLSHLPEAQKEKRFRNLTPEKFLRGDVDDLKATLGQLETAFADRLLISSDELKNFIKDRNLIAHNYWRLTKANIRDSEKLSDPEEFLREFTKKCDHWTSIISGLLYVFMEATAKKENRLSEISFSDQQLSDIKAYRTHAAKHLASKIKP